MTTKLYKIIYKYNKQLWPTEWMDEDTFLAWLSDPDHQSTSIHGLVVRETMPHAEAITYMENLKNSS